MQQCPATYWQQGIVRRAGLAEVYMLAIKNSAIMAITMTIETIACLVSVLDMMLQAIPKDSQYRHANDDSKAIRFTMIVTVVNQPSCESIH
jgi:hypothetical protein